MNTELHEHLVELFVKTRQAHHYAFVGSDGADPDWPIWYAEYLLESLSDALQTSFTRSQLIYCLMDADFEHTALEPDSDWPGFYADQFIERYAPSDSAPVDKLSLYHFRGCPFCSMVSAAINRLGIQVDERDIMQNSQYREQLLAARGRTTVPVLRIDSPDGEVRWMPESRDIVRYLESLIDES